MTKTELIDAVAAETGGERKDAKAFLDALTTVVERAMRERGEVPLKGLGKFKVQNRKARVGRNPITGAEVQIPAKTVVKFTVAKTLKGMVV
jgi:DNA-binding protein HU-beta